MIKKIVRSYYHYLNQIEIEETPSTIFFINAPRCVAVLYPYLFIYTTFK